MLNEFYYKYKFIFVGHLTKGITKSIFFRLFQVFFHACLKSEYPYLTTEKPRPIWFIAYIIERFFNVIKKDIDDTVIDFLNFSI